MKLLLFNVQIRAEFYDHKEIGRSKAARLLCQDINTILAKYDGSTGGAQIVHGPRNIRVTSDKATENGVTTHRRKPGRRCRNCHRPERIQSLGGVRLSNISPHLGLCAWCINTALKS